MEHIDMVEQRGLKGSTPLEVEENPGKVVCESTGEGRRKGCLDLRIG